MKLVVEVAAVEAAARQLDDAVAAARRMGAARRLGLVESALPGWTASRAAAEAAEDWSRIEVALALALGGQAQAMLEAAQGYRELETVTTSAFGAGR
ncbi:MAG: hypothetical protein ABIZ07_10660 [Dermatophilaceae bacterium]